MSPFPLETLGQRIMVLGPSNAGKSTLAAALSARLDLPLVHLDQLQHLPNTDWVPRPEEDFVALHDQAIQNERWIMDGNYSRLMPKRFERATGVMLLTSNHWVRLALSETNPGQSKRADWSVGGRSGTPEMGDD